MGQEDVRAVQVTERQHYQITLGLRVLTTQCHHFCGKIKVSSEKLLSCRPHYIGPGGPGGSKAAKAGN